MLVKNLAAKEPSILGIHTYYKQSYRDIFVLLLRKISSSAPVRHATSRTPRLSSTARLGARVGVAHSSSSTKVFES